MFPTLQRQYMQRAQLKLLAEYKSQTETMEQENDGVLEEKVSDVITALPMDQPSEILVETLVEDTDDSEDVTPQTDNTVETTEKPDPKKRAIGILQIDDIEFEQVIMPSASANDLNVSIGHIPETSWIDESGNIGIAGHRSKTYGRNFNRLEELKTGSEIKLITKNGEKSFEVVETLVVDPCEVWVLEPVDGKSMITLTTCTPMENPTHRFVVRGLEK